jgi:hypothetical protein
MRALRIRRDSIPATACVLLLLLFAALIVWCLAQTLDWRIGWDAAPIHYTAWRILQGDRLYADIFDVSWPGSVLLHAAAIGLFGRTDLAFRLFDLAWIGVIGASMLLYFGRTAWKGAVGAALCTIACYLAAGETNQQEREIQMLPFLILALHCAGLGIERKRRLLLLPSGLLLGFVVYLKPFPVVLCAMLAVFILASPAFGSGAKPRLAAIGCFGAGFAVASLLIHAWLWRMDAVSSFWQLAIVIHYRLYRSLYNSAPSVILSRFVLWTLPAWPVCAGIVLARKLDTRLALLLIGIGYGAFHYVYQGKGWSQHIYIVLAFAFMAGFSAVDSLLKGPHRALRYVAVALSAATMMLVSPLYLMSLARLHRHDLAYVESAMEDLRPLVRTRDEVQPIENMAGLIDAMYRMDLRIPARYWHSYPFLHLTGNPRADRCLQSMKDDFIARLSTEEVRIIIIDHADLTDIDRAFPALAALLAGRYSLYAANDRYSIYLRRGHGNS